MYGDGYFESVDYTVLHQRDRNILRIMPIEKRWGPDYARFAINLQADNSQGSNFGLRAAYHQTWLNELGGELIYHGEIGSTNRLGINYYQPLDARQRLFSRALRGWTNPPQCLRKRQADRPIPGQRDRHRRLPRCQHWPARPGSPWLGTAPSLFRSRYWRPSLPRADKRFSGWKASLDFDQFDRMYFPTRGWSAQLSWFQSPGANYARADADLRGAYAWGGTVFNGRLRYTGSPHGVLPVYDAGTIGGFLNLTAFATSQIIGDDIRYAGIWGEQIIGRLPLGLRGDMRIGLALEAAKVGSHTPNRDASA
jgi:NTE family protein